MDQFAERLGNDRRCVAIDIRGCGRSDDPPRFRLADAAEDVAAAVGALDLGSVDVVGHSLGGFVGGFYSTRTPGLRLVSIDGFGPGMVTVGTDTERAEFQSFQAEVKAAFFEMTSPPESGDAAWREAQIEAQCRVFPRIGYTAPNARVMAERNLRPVGPDRWVRRPPRHLFADAFEDDGAKDVLRMYQNVQGPTLIIRCTRSRSPAPPVLDLALDELVANNPLVEVARLPLTHLEPAWDAIDDVARRIHALLSI